MMFIQALKTTSAILCLSLVTLAARAQNVNEPQPTPEEWSKEYPPFRIVANLYYVGTYDLACYLITTSDGNILINTGLAASAATIRKNIEALGFRFADTKILTTTQAHFDHMGAIATIKKMTGAAFVVDEKDAGVAAEGGKSDYALGGTESSYEPVRADRLLHDGDTIKLGDMRIVMLHHPGHTKGSCSFLFNVKDEKRSYRVLVANLPTIVTEKKFSEIPSYPDIASDYLYTITAMKNLKFDIWVASHASQFALHTKHKPGDAYDPAAFIDRKGYMTAVSDLETALNKKLKDK